MNRAPILTAACATAVLGLIGAQPTTAAQMPPAIMAEVLPAGDGGVLVPNAVTIVINNDDSTRAFRIHQGGSCTSSYRVLRPGTSSEAWVSDVNSMRFYEDARVAVKSKSGATLYKVWGVNVAETSGASKCYISMSNDRLYEVLSRDGANVGADPY